jgi:predicted GH43/DUF377 family glycosyl hydrolase
MTAEQAKKPTRTLRVKGKDGIFSRRRTSFGLTAILIVALFFGGQSALNLLAARTAGGWDKDPSGPVIGGNLGTAFDLSILQDNGLYKAWFSWRPKDSIAYVESADGINWSAPVIALGPTRSGWEDIVNRPSVIKTRSGFAMWYTGQTADHSAIGYATSADGMHWARVAIDPVLVPSLPWEKVAVMSPDVRYDQASGGYSMWYSGGEQYEPDAIGYASSVDGLHWTKFAQNPIFSASGGNNWDGYKVTAADIEPYGPGGTGFVMFYIGFADVNHAQIGVAFSPDGITHWVRSSVNPIIRPGYPFTWDSDAVYKPAVIHAAGRWLLWYNGRSGAREQIGRALHEGDTLSP